MAQKQLSLIALDALTVRYSLLSRHKSSEKADKFLRGEGFDLGGQELGHLLVHSVEHLGEYLYLNTLLKGDTATPDHTHAYCGRESAYWELNRTLTKYLDLLHYPEFSCDDNHLLVTYHQAMGRITRVARELDVNINVIERTIRSSSITRRLTPFLR